MRALHPAPDTAIDPSTGEPRFGSYRGALPKVDLSAVGVSSFARIARHKRWLYAMIVSDDLLLAVAVVRLGYAATTFAYAFDRRMQRMRFSGSVKSPVFACDVGDSSGEGCRARFRVGGTRVAIERAVASPSYVIDATFRGFELRAVLDTTGAPPPLTAIAPIPGGPVNTTEKRALLRATGEVTLDGRRFSLDGALAGTDYTNGLLARHTAWRWAFLLGRARGGEQVGLNLVQGFVGEPECAVWVDGDVLPLAEGRFAFNQGAPLDEWRVTTADAAVDLRFTPGGMHAEQTNLGLVRTSFVQPAGLYSGTIALEGRAPLVLDGVLGVTEDQDVLW